MLAVAVLAVLGVFGNGVLSSATASTPDGTLSADYPRFGRYQSAFTVELRAGRGAISDGQVLLWINNEYADAVSIELITPEPASARLDEGRLLLEFEAESAAEVSVTLAMRWDRIGKQTARIGIDGGSSLTFWQLVYP